MPFCSTCSAAIAPTDEHCPECGREIVRIVDARPGATVTVSGAKRVQAMQTVTSRGIVEDAMNLIWGTIWTLVFWAIALSITYSLFGEERLGLQVVATGVAAGVVTALLGEWWKGVKAKAEDSASKQR